MDQYQVRENLRNQIKSFWQEGITWTPKEVAINDELKRVHAEIIQLELLDETKPKERVVFSVCGWSKKHGYFREKRLVVATLEEAKAELAIAKQEANWHIPTVIIKETYFRKNCPAMVDFDGDIEGVSSCSDTQEIVDKSMCGNRHYRWKDLIPPWHTRYTY